ncbi:hypothetical protein AAY473_004878 [Plecturocebus cupreus]
MLQIHNRQKNSWERWLTPVIPALWVAEVGGSRVVPTLCLDDACDLEYPPLLQHHGQPASLTFSTCLTPVSRNQGEEEEPLKPSYPTSTSIYGPSPVEHPAPQLVSTFAPQTSLARANSSSEVLAERPSRFPNACSYTYSKEIHTYGQAQWLMSVILALWEAKPFGRPSQAERLSPGVRDQPGQHGKILTLQKIQKLAGYRSMWL